MGSRAGLDGLAGIAKSCGDLPEEGLGYRVIGPPLPGIKTDDFHGVRALGCQVFDDQVLDRRLSRPPLTPQRDNEALVAAVTIKDAGERFGKRPSAEQIFARSADWQILGESLLMYCALGPASKTLQ